MNTIELCSLLARATYLVYAVKGNEILCTGSAVAISKEGHLLTAAHVISDFEAAEVGYRDPEVQILARSKEGDLKPYNVLFGPLKLQEYFLREPLVIDIAILAPQTAGDEAVALPLWVDPVPIGTEVLMAGFSNEIRPPFDFADKIDESQVDPEVLPNLKLLQHHSGQMMIKRGMIGYVSQFDIQDGQLRLNGDILYIDNVMHSGASGGPVIDANGALIGVITHFARTYASVKESPKIQLHVPSGTAVALSARTIQPLLQWPPRPVQEAATDSLADA